MVSGSFKNIYSQKKKILTTIKNSQSRMRLENQHDYDYKKIFKHLYGPDGDVVPRDPNQFYDMIGHLHHDNTKKEVKRLADFQIDFWQSVLDNQYNIAIKSNKIGLSTVALMALFQNCLFFKNAGNEKIVTAQKLDMAKEHLYTLKNMILNSKVFSRFLITKPTKYLSKDEVTKTTMLFIHNPYFPSKPTRIIAVGASAGSTVSWKRVDFALVSDIAASSRSYDQILNGLFTRLAITRGKMVIETIPSLSTMGRVYEIYINAKKNINGFKWFKFPVEVAIKAEIVSQEQINGERERLGAFFPLFYGAEFLAVGGNVFTPEQIHLAETNADKCSKILYMERLKSMPKAMGVDPAFSSTSKFARTIWLHNPPYVQMIKNVEKLQANFNEAVNETVRDIFYFNVPKIYVDAAKVEFIQALKEKLNDVYNSESPIRRRDWQRGEDPLDELRERTGKVISVSWNRYGMPMLYHAQRLVSDGKVAIDGILFPEVIHQMGVASIINEESVPRLDKQTYGTNDSLDSSILGLTEFKYTPEYMRKGTAFLIPNPAHEEVPHYAKKL
jgi:hypothetical protein